MGDRALTQRQMDVLTLRAQGYTNDECAVLLGISEQTAKNHVTSALAAAGGINTTHLVAVLVERGQIALNGVSQSVNTTVAPPFSKRKHQILELLAHGAPYKETAHRLGICETTARHHMFALRQQLGAGNNIDMIRLATKNGWVE